MLCQHPATYIDPTRARDGTRTRPFRPANSCQVRADVFFDRVARRVQATSLARHGQRRRPREPPAPASPALAQSPLCRRHANSYKRARQSRFDAVDRLRPKRLPDVLPSPASSQSSVPPLQSQRRAYLPAAHTAAKPDPARRWPLLRLPAVPIPLPASSLPTPASARAAPAPAPTTRLLLRLAPPADARARHLLPRPPRLLPRARRLSPAPALRHRHPRRHHTRARAQRHGRWDESRRLGLHVPGGGHEGARALPAQDGRRAARADHHVREEGEGDCRRASAPDGAHAQLRHRRASPPRRAHHRHQRRLPGQADRHRHLRPRRHGHPHRVLPRAHARLLRARQQHPADKGPRPVHPRHRGLRPRPRPRDRLPARPHPLHALLPARLPLRPPRPAVPQRKRRRRRRAVLG